MSRVRTLVVDDEPPARRRLTTLLASWPTIDIVGEAGDGLEAIELIETLRPDLLLLDIRMPALDGFGVLSALDPTTWPVVVFLTAFDEFAVRAFEVGAVDYVLKPVSPERFATAIARALERIAASSGDHTALRAVVEEATEASPLDRFVVRSLDRLRIIAAGEVRWIEAAGNYVKLHLADGTHLVRGTLQDVERRLDPVRFVRIHRSTIVALPEVRHFEPAGHGDCVAVLHSGDRLAVSRRFRDRLPPPLFQR